MDRNPSSASSPPTALPRSPATKRPVQPARLALLGALACGVPAQVQWTSPEAVGARSHAAAAFDAARGRLVLFGGKADVSELNDTWEWDGTRWLAQHPAQVPTLPYGTQAVYDPVTARVLLYGGVTVQSFWQPQLWSWDGSAWTRLANPPSLGNVTYDASAQRLLLLAPGTFPGPLIVHEWNGTQWSTRTTTGAVPTWFDLRRWAYDAQRGCVVLPVPGAVYELHGSVWQRHQPANMPVIPNVNFLEDPHTVTYDARLRGVVVYGGRAGDPTPMPLSLWNGTTWQTLGTAAARQDHATVFDAQNQRLLVVGGREFRNNFYPEWRCYGDLRAYAGTWQVLHDESAPGHLAGPAAAYDRDRARIVTFGGTWDDVPTDESYAHDGVAWRPDDLPTRPPARAEATMVYDTARARLVLFGGRGANGLLSDTWVRDAQGWRALTPATSPSPRRGARMVYDAVRQVVVLVGGETATQIASETWELVGDTWNLRVAGYPPASAFGGLAFDSRRARTVLHGGFAGDATYEWDGANWHARNATQRPPPDLQQICAMTYDPHRGRTVLLVAGWPGPRTWEWDGTEWSETTAAAPRWTISREPTFVAHEAARGCLLLPGATKWPGLTVWTATLLKSVHPATWTPYGQGCAGTAGTPRLEPAEESLPWLGDAFTVRLTHPGATRGALVLGLSATTWAGNTLPLALGPTMPGCSLLASLDEIRVLGMQQGRGTDTFALPLLPALVGIPLHYQAVAEDGLANAAGLVVSAGGRAQLGLR